LGIKKIPFNYEHPGKKKLGRSEIKQETPARVENDVLAVKEKRGGRPKPLQTTAAKSSPTSSAKTVFLRLVVKPPKAGRFELYDEMIADGLTPKQAILGLLKHGFFQFEKDIKSNKISAKNLNYEAVGQAVETTRSVDPEFISLCRDVFDKFDILSNRALGQKIGEAIFHRAATER